MDDTAQNIQSPSSGAPPAPQPQTTPPVQPAQAPQTPVGSVAKEHELPIAPQPESYVQPTEVAPVLHEEVEKAGVEVTPLHEPPVISEEAKKAGLTHAKEATPVSTQPSGMVKLPMDPKQAHIILQTHKKISESVVWLAMLIIRQVKMMHQKVAGDKDNVST